MTAPTPEAWDGVLDLLEVLVREIDKQRVQDLEMGESLLTAVVGESRSLQPLVRLLVEKGVFYKAELDYKGSELAAAIQVEGVFNQELDHANQALNRIRERIATLRADLDDSA